MLNSLKVALVEFANGKYQTILCPFTFTKFANPNYAPEETWSSLRNASRIHPNPGPLAPGHAEEAASPPLITLPQAFHFKVSVPLIVG